MKPARSRFRGWRLLALAVLTWFFGSLLFAPMFNPWVAWRIRTDGPTLMLLQQANIEGTAQVVDVPLADARVHAMLLPQY